MIEPTQPTLSQDQPADLGGFRGWDVYPMPMFVRLETRDVERTTRWFTDALGFGVMFVGPTTDGHPTMTHVRGARYQDVLIVGSDTAPKPVSSPIQVTFQALTDDAVDELASRASAHGRVDGPHTTPWNTREVTVYDPNGNPFVFTGRLTSVEPIDFNDVMGGSTP
jgi:catechol 2,3-dioxygenase-like lactoylglutathione lyase family enzyme